MKIVSALTVAIVLTTTWSSAEPAGELLDAAGIKGGLVVAIRGDDPTFLMGLRANDGCLVRVIMGGNNNYMSEHPVGHLFSAWRQ